jgi:predicted small lipoprotein YifL
MKKVIALLAALCLLLSLTACSGSNDPVKTEPQNNETQGTTAPTGDPNAFYFTYEGTEIRLHADMAPILEKLGQPKKYTESASCAFEGLDKTYTYDSFVIQTYPQGDKDYVYCFWFVDDFAQTNEGIKIGDSQDKVETAYGAESFNGSNAYTLTKGDGVFTVIIKDGVVSSIQYAVSIG